MLRSLLNVFQWHSPMWRCFSVQSKDFEEEEHRSRLLLKNSIARANHILGESDQKLSGRVMRSVSEIQDAMYEVSWNTLNFKHFRGWTVWLASPFPIAAVFTSS